VLWGRLTTCRPIVNRPPLPHDNRIMRPSSNIVLAGALLSTVLSAQIPATDTRNTTIPHTDFHFAMPKYATLPE
jgi:hypothetical protein